MEWDEIKRFVEDEKDLFDSESPSPNHEERFKSKLNQRFNSNRQIIIRIAASVAMVMIVTGILVLLHFNLKMSPVHNSVASHSTIELNETEAFYKEQISKELEHLNQLHFPDPVQKASVLKELSAMDQNYKQLKSELNKNPDDERLINGIVENYQVKLEAISHIINSLKYCQTNSKINNHEEDI